MAFAPVRVLPDAASNDRGLVDVVLASGERLVVREGVSIDLLRTIVSALRLSC